MMTVPSPITHSTDTTLLKSFHTAQLIQDWRESFKIDITEEMRGYEQIHLYQCNQTGLQFFTPLDTIGSGKLYAQLQRFEWYYMPNKWEHQVALKDLGGCQRVLEIGSGAGAFVQTAIASGIDIQGIELNEIAVQMAQQNDLPIDRLDLTKAVQSYAGIFDAVCSFQVLEHVCDPKQFIEESVQLLKPGGSLIYCVPNAESFLKHQYNILDMPPHHMLLWSKTAFKALESLFPLRLEQVIYEPLATYHVAAYLETYSNVLRQQYPIAKLAINQHTLPFYEKCLNLGFRKFLKGQSLYVRFRKLA